MSDDHQQNALADVYELAATLHALRSLSADVECLLAAAIATARRAGLPQTLIAEAAALSPGRISQIIAAGTDQPTATTLRDRAHAIREYPADELRPYRATFAGHMTFPPYRRRPPRSQ